MEGLRKDKDTSWLPMSQWPVGAPYPPKKKNVCRNIPIQAGDGYWSKLRRFCEASIKVGDTVPLAERHCKVTTIGLSEKTDGATRVLGSAAVSR